MKKTKFIFTLMLGCSLATMAKAGTSYDNCVAAVGAENAANCVQIGDSGTYYALSGEANNQTMTIYGTTEEGSNPASVPENAFMNTTNGSSTLDTNIKSLKTEGSVSIGTNAFINATGLTSADLTGVIVALAFQNATGLTSVDLTGVQSIGLGAFRNATSLTSIDLTGVQEIGESAFENATSLTSVVLPDSFFNEDGSFKSGIDKYAFFGSSVSTIYLPEGACGENTDCLGYFKDCSGFVVQGVCRKGTESQMFSESNIKTYSKNDDGTYTVGDNTYATSDMMTKNITCEGAQCTALRMALNAGGTCATQTACNTLAAEYATPQPSQPTKPQRADIRIYTIDEANAVAGKVNRVSIKYR